MNTAEIKLDLFRKLDSLKGKNLEKAYGMITNLINGNEEIDEWDHMTNEQKNAISEGIAQLDKGEGRNHIEILSELKKKYSDE